MGKAAHLTCFISTRVAHGISRMSRKSQLGRLNSGTSWMIIVCSSPESHLLFVSHGVYLWVGTASSVSCRSLKGESPSRVSDGLCATLQLTGAAGTCLCPGGAGGPCLGPVAFLGDDTFPVNNKAKLTSSMAKSEGRSAACHTSG